MSSFSPEIARRIPGPEWLRGRREAAAERFRDSELPTAGEEVWRYSRIGELDLGRFDPVANRREPSAGEPEAVVRALGELPRLAGLVVLRDGLVARCELDESLSAKGVRLEPLSADDAGAEERLGSVASQTVDVFGVLNDAFTADPIAFTIPAGVIVSDPVAIVSWAEVEGAAVFPRVIASLADGAEATILDLEMSADVESFVAPVVELDVGPGARLGYLNLQAVSPSTWRIASHAARLGREASMVSAQVGLGGAYARTRVDCRLEGRGASARLLAAYSADDDQMLDFRTFQEHLAPDTVSDLLFKGVVDDNARSVYSGLIHVHPDAPRTNALQTNRNIKLGEHAWAESVPNLVIENNDVRCSHASAVGPVDEEQLFYLESRGVPPEVAATLIVKGFFDEVLQGLPVPGMAQWARRGLVRGRVANEQPIPRGPEEGG